MRKLLTLIALSFVAAVAGGISSSTANASPLTSAAHSFKAKQTGVVEKAYYRRYYRRVARRHYRRAYYYGAANYGYAYHRPAYYYGGVHYRHHRRVARRVYRRHY
jgi:hypothetical protein